MVKGEVDRYTIGLFSIPKPGSKIKAPEDMVDEKHPLLYKPFDYAEYLKFYFAGEKGLDTLKEYCGA